MAQKPAGRQKLFGRWRSVPSWARDLARIGYFAKALTYLLIGGIALYEALRNRGPQSSPSQAMHLLRLQPLGTIPLALLAAGMCCYGVHRCSEAILGPVRTNSTLLEALHRLGRIGGGLAYLGFAALAVAFIFSRQRSGHSKGPELARHLMHHSLGNTLLVAIGVVLLCLGGKCFYDVFSGRYRRSYQLPKGVRAAALAIESSAVAGICARGVFFFLCGALTIWAGIDSDPSRARGMEGVLAMLRKLPAGQWLIAGVALGFISYALFCVVRAVYGTYPSDSGV